MDILNRSVVHTARTPCFGVQSTLKHRTEYCRGNIRPVNVGTPLFKQQFFQLFGKRRYLYLALEQTAVDIRESRKRRLKELVPVLRFGVKNLKQFLQVFSEMLYVCIFEVVIKLIVL